MTLTGGARLAGVIGWPVAHSRSPRLHGYWLERYQIDGAYVPLAVNPADLADAVTGLRAAGFKGFNVTVPHKEAMLGLMDTVDAVARRIGAVNTVVIGEDGRLSGSNTDAFGFMAHLDACCPDRPRGRPAVVLGAGGAARAICTALIDGHDGEIRLVNRTVARAEALAAEIGGAITVHDWAARTDTLADAGLLVNTTVLGMTGKAPLDIALDHLPRDAVVNDIVYVPLQTELLAAAAARGNPTVDGLGMLLHQARPGFAAWFGRDPEVDTGLHEFVLADLT